MAKKRKLYQNASYEDMVCVLESNKHLDITEYAKKLRMISFFPYLRHFIYDIIKRISTFS